MRRVCPVTENGAVIGMSFRCAGCDDVHCVPVPPHPRAWQWNGSLDLPTFAPSILVTYRGIDDDGQPIVRVCHSFVRDGKIQYLSDCDHPLAGQTIDLPEVE